MRRHWFLWAPFGLFVAGWAALGLRYGYLAATTTESDIIVAYAQRYLEARKRAGDDTARLTDCMAYPGQKKGVWIVVVCGGVGSDYTYYVNRIGRFVHGGDGPMDGPMDGVSGGQT